MSNETPAEVLEVMRHASPQCARFAARLERSLAAGKVVAQIVPCHVPSGKRVALNTEYQHLPIGTKLYLAPPADPAKKGNPLTRDNEESLMLALAEFITASAYPEDPRLEVAYAIARHLNLGWPAADPAKAREPEYDRSLIADMLEDCHMRGHVFHGDAVEEQIRLLRAADNADAAKVRTVRGSGSAPDGMIDITTCTPPDGELVLVYTPDNGDGERYDFDYWEDGGWAIHAQNYDHFVMVGGSAAAGPDCVCVGPSEEAPYTHWSRLPKPGNAATPPASAPEVTDAALFDDALAAAFEKYPHAHDGLTFFACAIRGTRQPTPEDLKWAKSEVAALQQEGKSHG